MVIYADVLVALNILLTYILLVSARVLCRMPTNKWAILVASVLGGLSALVIFYEGAGAVFSSAYKIVTGALIVAIAFLPHRIKSFFKVLVAFIGVSLLFGGAMYAAEIILKPRNLLFFNGTVYFDMSISYLVGSVLSIYGVFLMADYILSKRTAKGGKCGVEISLNNKSVFLTGFIDTGNTLADGASGRPVIIAELKSLAPVLTREELLFFKSGEYKNIPKSLERRIRLVPCSAVTGESVLTCFLPDYIRLEMDNVKYKTSFCAVGVAAKALSGEDYTVLLNNNIFENVREEKADEKAFT